MQGDAFPIRFGWLAVAGGFACLGCGEPVDHSRPADLQGTRDTALQLVLGGHAVVDQPSPIELCLNPTGLCVPSEYRVDECFRYDDIEVDLDGVSIPQTISGGWSAVQRFAPLPSGGHGYGCNYPAFELADFGVPLMPRTQTLTIKIQDETIVITVLDWLLERSLSVPATLVKGTDVFVGLEPSEGVGQRQAKSEGTYFKYDDIRLTHEWYCAKYGCKAGTEGSDLEISEVDESAWTVGGFIQRVPTNMPAGVGRFGYDEAWAPVEVTNCPFSSCDVTVNRSVEALGITIADP
jgi:hypothetical protein